MQNPIAHKYCCIIDGNLQSETSPLEVGPEVPPLQIYDLTNIYVLGADVD
jgi:hypothetical protein